MLVTPLDKNKLLGKKLLDRVDGLLISGGGGDFFQADESPSIPIDHDLSVQQKRRYVFESLLIKEAYLRDMPTLGICRGHQMIGEVLGGKLRYNYIKNHTVVKGSRSATGNHPINLAKTSLLSNICECKTWLVNSYHTQVLETAPPGFSEVAWSEEGYIEAIEANSKKFFIGVQFHPEKFHYKNKEAQKLFKSYIEKASIYHMAK